MAAAGRFRNYVRLGVKIVGAIAGLVISCAASAQGGVPGYPFNIRDFDPREVAMLPRFCLFTQDFRDHVDGGSDKAQIQHWYDTLGESFHHMHHFCYALMDINRGTILAQDPYIRNHYMNNAILEFNYVLSNATKDFVMLPEIHARKGETLVRIGRGPLAVSEFERAIELKPDYWAPYAYLSDYYKEAGDLAKARSSLEAGLAKIPDAKGLQRRLAELDAEPAKRKSGSKPAATNQSSSK